MTRPVRYLVLAGCVVATLACGGADNVAPRAESSSVFTALVVGPVSVLLAPGETVALTVLARDQRAERMVPHADAITYASSDPAVATVANSGIITAVAPGTAHVTVTVTIGAVSRAASVVVGVRVPEMPQTPPSAVPVLFGAWGWEPRVLHVEAGTLVEWAATGTSWSGVPTHTLWVMDANYAVIEQLDLTGGVAKREFSTPGTYRFCAGGCWDLPDYGVIHVH